MAMGIMSAELEFRLAPVLLGASWVVIGPLRLFLKGPISERQLSTSAIDNGDGV